ncbi:MAG: RNA polymerase sigma factor [Actinomycetota bacterium]|nr:RNA polymerase sigma factor [Actinomycetota bacterium]
MVGPEFGRLLAAAQRGDEQAFATLYRDAQPVLLRYLRVAADPGTAEDVAAETWVSVVRGLQKFRGDEQGWRSWLVTTARRRAVDAGRLRDRHPTVPLERGHEPAAAPPAEAVALQGLDTAAALALVATLPPQQAEAIVLRVVVGLEPKQVAAVLGCSPGAVRVAVHRGLRRLAELM